jgi:hypothetical protein
MSRLVRTSSVAALIFGLGATIGVNGPAIGEQPAAVTSDTPEYCRQLAVRLDELTTEDRAVPTAVRDLSTAGRTMCDHGLTRGGIMRLRSAIVMMLDEQHAARTPNDR